MLCQRKRTCFSCIATFAAMIAIAMSAHAQIKANQTSHAKWLPHCGDAKNIKCPELVPGYNHFERPGNRFASSPEPAAKNVEFVQGNHCKRLTMRIDPVTLQLIEFVDLDEARGTKRASTGFGGTPSPARWWTHSDILAPAVTGQPSVTGPERGSKVCRVRFGSGPEIVLQPNVIIILDATRAFSLILGNDPGIQTEEFSFA